MLHVYNLLWFCAHTHPGAFAKPWILPRAKNCSTVRNFCTSVRTGAALSNPSSGFLPIKKPHRLVWFFIGRG